jgi:1-pyrroline-5-carboxylate dehydrogenase
MINQHAVVGQQPLVEQEFGTNDKAGSPLNLLRWVSPRTKKLL